MKVCSDCGKRKPLGDYYTTMQAGRLRIYSRCKGCHHARMQALRHASPKYAAAHREWCKRHDHHRAYRAQNRDRINANARARYAKKRGMADVAPVGSGE